MALVPSGKRRLMIAQMGPAMQQGLDSVDIPNEAAALNEAEQVPGEEQIEIDELQNDVEDVQEEAGPPSLTKFIFNFMAEKLAYPPRRLQEFKSQFVNEQGAKGQPSKYTVTLPDQVYGKEQEIPAEMLKFLVNGIEQKFGLSFVDYKRADLKLILSFSSEDPAARQSLEEGPGDILDQVYKSPGGKNKGSSNLSATASTLNEMIKENKGSMAAYLQKVLGV